MGSYNTAHSEQTPEASSATMPQPQGSGMRISVPPAGRQEPGSPPPLSATKLKKPALPRRTSTRRQVPHRGQEFSVDDAVTEYEEDHAREYTNWQQPAQPPSPMITPLRRQTSTLRRRVTAQQPTPLPRVDSQDEEDEET